MITEDGALVLVATLVTTTTGWNDDAVDATVTMIQRTWEDAAAARDAVKVVCDTWTKSSRPPWGILNEAYNAERRRRALATPAIRAGAAVGLIDFNGGGREIMARAYVAECARRPMTDPLIMSGFRSHEPNQSILDSILGLHYDDIVIGGGRGERDS